VRDIHFLEGRWHLSSKGTTSPLRVPRHTRIVVCAYCQRGTVIPVLDVDEVAMNAHDLVSTKEVVRFLHTDLAFQ
jgi:hypothetical protein